MKRIKSRYIYEMDNKYYDHQSLKPKKMHGLFIVDGIMEGYWEGEKLDLEYPDIGNIELTYDGFPKDIYPIGDIIFEEGVGIYLEYVDRDGETIAYYDFIDGEIKKY